MVGCTVVGYQGRSLEPFFSLRDLAEAGLTLTRTSAQSIGLMGHQVFTVRLFQRVQPSLDQDAKVCAMTAARPLFEQSARLRLGPFDLPPQVDWALAQGWQCWSESPILNRKGVLAEDGNRDRWCFGDTHFYPYDGRPGHFHSWFFSYCGFSEEKQAHGFLCSDGQGLFAVAFFFELDEGRVWVDVDCAGFDWSRLDAGDVVVRFVLPSELMQASVLPLSDCARSYLSFCRPEKKRMSLGLREGVPAAEGPVRGYTSWYHHYSEITEDLILRNLRAAPAEMSVFQIDDGYQMGIGEWTAFRPSFAAGHTPRGLMEAIRARGLTPGVWLAPFVAVQAKNDARSPLSLVEREGDSSGRMAAAPVRCGTFDHWGGPFFAVDTESASFRVWLDRVVSFWKEQGVGFLKCDFLYAAGMVPGAGMTRLERACRAHVALDETVRSHGLKWLSCGGIVEQAFLSADFSRIGADVGLDWEDPDRANFASRERVSTRSCITNTVTRSLLSGAAFLNDGDVSILRDADSRLSGAQKETLLKVNGALSDLQFVSCDLFAWSSSACERYTRLLSAQKFKKVLSIQPQFSDEGMTVPDERRGWACAYRLNGQSVSGARELMVDLQLA